MKSNKFVRGIFGLILSCFVIAVITSCTQPGGGYSPAFDPDDLLGSWENNDWGYHSEYAVSKNQINDKSMGVLYNVVSDSTVKTTDGYILFFCQVAEGSGTEYTPAGNFYAVGMKLEGGLLKICCPLDYRSVLTTLEELQNKYPSSYTFAGSGNSETVCTKMGSSVTLNSDYYIKITFEKDKVALYPGTADPEWYFVPTRNKGKEKENVVLYLYSSQDKLGVSDGHYLTIQYNADVDGKVVYWYCYEDESEEDDQNDENLAAMYPDCMPTVSDSDLEKILALYE